MTLGGYREIEESGLESFTNILMRHLSIINEIIKEEIVENHKNSRFFQSLTQNKQIKNGKGHLQIVACQLIGKINSLLFYFLFYFLFILFLFYFIFIFFFFFLFFIFYFL